MDGKELADAVVALDVGECRDTDYIIYDPHAADYMYLSYSAFICSWLVAGLLMEKIYEKRYSFMVMQMPDERPMMTIQAPIQTAGEYADPSTRNSWAGQAIGDSVPRAICEACVEALT